MSIVLHLVVRTRQSATWSPKNDALHWMYFVVLTGCLTKCHGFRLGLLLEDGNGIDPAALNISLDFIQKEQNQLHGVNVTLIQRSSVEHNTTDAIAQVCELFGQGISGLLTLSSCESISVIRSQQSVFQVPHLAVYSGHCPNLRHFKDSFSLSLLESDDVTVNLLEQMIAHLGWTHIVLFYDHSFADHQVQSILFRLASLFVQTDLVHVRDGSNINYQSTLLFFIEKNSPKTSFVVMLNKNSTEQLIKAAQGVGILKVPYYWLVIGQDTSTHPLTTWGLRTGNVAIVTKTWLQESCSTKLARIMNERLPNIKWKEALLVDALVTLAHAVHSREKEEGDIELQPPSIDCRVTPATTLKHGPAILNNLRKVNTTGITGAIYFDENGYNGNTQHNIYSMKTSSQFTLVGTWDNDNGLHVSQTVFQDLPVGFNNVTFRVGAKEAVPFIRRNITGNATDYDGFCVDMLDELAGLLNFRYKLVEPDDGLWGAEKDDGSFNGIIGMVSRKELDFGIGPITVNAERERGIDFSTPFMEDGVGIVMKRPTEEANNIFRMFRPFHGFVWLALAGSVLLIGVVLYFFIRISHSGLSFSEPGRHAGSHSLRESLWLIFSSVTEQGAESHPVSVPGRLIVGTWWIVTILMVASYTANLAAFLTVAIVDKPVDTLEDLAYHSEILPLAKTGTSIYSAFRTGRTETDRKIWEKLQTVPQLTDNSEAYDYVRTGAYAFLVDRTQLEYLVNQDCETFMLADESFDNAGLGFVFPENSHLLEKFSYNIIRMQEAGLIERWKQKWWPSSDTCSTSGPASKAKRLCLDSTGGPFIIYGAAVGAAFICLIVEKICKSVCP